MSVAAPEPEFAAGLPTWDDNVEVTDLYGNTVSAAVAKYQFDGTGSPYEVHSPQTEMPRLKPPRT